MKAHPQIEITVYQNGHSYTRERQRNINWLQVMIPVIMKTQKMVTDNLYIAPLGQAISLCLS